MIFTALLFLTLISTSQTQTAPIVMTAAVGETITVECPQAERYKGNSVIWWCRTISGTRCDQISSIDGQKVRNYYRGTSIANTNGTISVTIRHLHEVETGAYCCGLEDNGSFNISDVILLKVFAGTWEPIVSEIRGVGNTATVPCQYTEEEKYYKKFLCKVTSINKCTIIASSDGAVNNLQNGSVSITINNSHNFTVTLGNINKADEGEYWCGAVTIKNIKIVQVKNLTTAAGRPRVSNDTSREDQLKIWTIFRWLLFGALAVCSASVTCYAHFAKGPVMQASKLWVLWKRQPENTNGMRAAFKDQPEG
ncbi:polymeric immunoglobulin receptor-like isoform X2 [Scyliorhinus torazame]|uniref:polymeric immunoglobulin receptor-like isoform X2 n=1 Tax=Scyliorhinus torazame TaxID=75743 RepID=UPI003B5AD98F